MNHGVLVPLFAREVLHEGVHVFGLLMASLGAGAVVGAVVVATLGYARPPLAAVVIPGMGVALGDPQPGVRPPLRPGRARLVPDRRAADRLPERLQHDRPGHGSGRTPGPRHGRLHDGLRRRDARGRLAHRFGRGGRGRAGRLPRGRRACARSASSSSWPAGGGPRTRTRDRRRPDPETGAADRRRRRLRKMTDYRAHRGAAPRHVHTPAAPGGVAFRDTAAGGVAQFTGHGALELQLLAARRRGAAPSTRSRATTTTARSAATRTTSPSRRIAARSSTRRSGS